MATPEHDRTDSKLQFAEVHLREIEENLYKAWNDGSPEEIAHEESLLYHLIGAKDAFLLEIYRGKGLTPGDIVNEQSLERDLKKAGATSRAFSELQLLRNQADSWLQHAISLRNHGTHRHRVPRIYDRGTHAPNVRVRHPVDAKIDWEVPGIFREWIDNMRSFLNDLRTKI